MVLPVLPSSVLKRLVAKAGKRPFADINNFFSTSPNSIISQDLFYESNHDDGKKIASRDDHRGRTSGILSLREFANAIPETLRSIESFKKSIHFGERARVDALRGTVEDPINQLFRRLDISRKEWRQYAMFDFTKKYTRNLIATDDETFTLLLLCWNPNMESPIHDHPCDGCWMRACEGAVQETRYEHNVQTDCLEVKSNEVFTEGKLAYINDVMGYHKIGNPSSSIPAITMHLYCPPIKKCKIWSDATKASCPSRVHVCNHSEYGVRNEWR